MMAHEAICMPLIIPIIDLRKTNGISEVAHREQKPIFKAIYESEKEMSESGELMDFDEAFERLNKKCY